MAPKPTKAEKEKRKREEQERLAALEAERLQKEQEEEERRQEELRVQEEERLRKLEEEQKRFGEESKVSAELIHDQAETLERILAKMAQDEQWRHTIECDPSVDVHSIPALSSFIREWTDSEMTSETCFDDTMQKHHEGSVIIYKLDRLIAELEDSKIPLYAEMRQNIEEFMAQKLDDATQVALATSKPHISPESFNLEKTATNKEIALHLWANTAKNPRLKSIEFTEAFPFSMSLPKDLLLANIGVRVIHSKIDSLSPLSKSYKMPKRKTKPEAVEEPSPQEAKPGEEGDDNSDKGDQSSPSVAAAADDISRPQSKQSNQGTPDAPEMKATSASDVKSAASTKTEKTEEDDEEEKEKESIAEGDLENQEQHEEDKDAIEDEFEEDDELYDEHLVDLRNFRPVGGIYHLNLVELPPQPKTFGVWTCQEVVSTGLRYTTYPLPEEKKKVAVEEPPVTPAPGAQKPSSAKAKDTEGGGAQKAAEPSGPEKVELLFNVPNTVTFIEEPQLARWDSSAKQWRTDGFDDFNYDQATGNVTFKTIHLASYALVQDIYAILPFMNWELRPGPNGHILLSIDTRLCTIDIEIKEDVCCIAEKPPNVAEGDAADDQDQLDDPLSHLRGNWMTREKLQDIMTRCGANIFPFDDGSRFVSVTRKEPSLESHVYDQMARLSPGFAFSGSRWNSKGKRTAAVIRYCEKPDSEDLIPDESWHLCLVSEERSFRLATRENDEDYCSDSAEDTEPHPDVYNCLRVGASVEAMDAVRSASPLTIDTVKKFINSTRLLVFS